MLLAMDGSWGKNQFSSGLGHDWLPTLLWMVPSLYTCRQHQLESVVYNNDDDDDDDDDDMKVRGENVEEIKEEGV